MAIRNYILIGLCVAFAAVPPLAAQGARAELYGGYVYAKVNPDTPLKKEDMNGWVASVTGYANSWFGVGGEISGAYGDLSSAKSYGPAPHGKEYSYLFGPQFRFLDSSRISTSIRILLGGTFGQVKLNSSTTSSQQQALLNAGYQGFNQTKFAALFALPVDVGVTKLVALRVEPGLYVTDFNQTGLGNFRISVGPVFRFGGK